MGELVSLYALSLSSLEILLLPVKTVGSSAEVLEVAPCHLGAWVGTLTGREGLCFSTWDGGS